MHNDKLTKIYFAQLSFVPRVPKKLLGSAVCDTIYTIYPSVHNQLIFSRHTLHLLMIDYLKYKLNLIVRTEICVTSYNTDILQRQ